MAEDRVQELRRRIATCRCRLAEGEASEIALADLAEIAGLEVELAELVGRQCRAALADACRHPG